MDKEKNKKKKTIKITKKDDKKRFNLSLGVIVLIVVTVSILAAGVSAYATTTLINSREVKYDNSTSGINATNVQDAIVELNNNATDYSTIISRLNALEGKIYPVGSIYISINNTNPSSLFGGTWVVFGQGRTLIGVNTSDGDFNASEKTGGSKTKSLAVTNLPAHTHSIPALSGSAASAGGHTHTFSGTTSSTAHTHKIITTPTSAAQTYSEKVTGYTGGLVATGEANVTTGPYYRHPISNGMYNDGDHTHTYSGTTSNNGAHTHTVSTNASTSGSSGSGTAFSTMDPYITVYMWKRTA